jgi:hypothetical protein
MASGSRIGLLAVAAGLAVALGAAAKRLAGRQAAGPDTHRCDCGTVYLLQGIDRHRIYWHQGEAVVAARCVVCDAPLPSGRAV